MGPRHHDLSQSTLNCVHVLCKDARQLLPHDRKGRSNGIRSSVCGACVISDCQRSCCLAASRGRGVCGLARV
eukprot:2038018-Rhodomonas_salina.4